MTRRQMKIGRKNRNSIIRINQNKQRLQKKKISSLIPTIYIHKKSKAKFSLHAIKKPGR